MDNETKRYLEIARKMNDNDLIADINKLIKRDEVLTLRYNRLTNILDNQAVRIRLFNPIYKSVQDIRKKVCEELNPLIDIRNNLNALLYERGLVLEDNVVSYEPNHQLDFTKVGLGEAI